MNLVIDDAVEVKLATKTEEEKRRPLGRIVLRANRERGGRMKVADEFCGFRPDFTQGRQRVVDSRRAAVNPGSSRDIIVEFCLFFCRLRVSKRTDECTRHIHTLGEN